MGTVLSAGIPAYNEGPRLRRAVRSLLDQRLPAGTTWGDLWIVVSGCTDDTASIARELERQDARVRLLEQPLREGKASALAQIFRRAQGDLLVLLNGDAEARAGAVEGLLKAAAGQQGAFAVMGRPCLHPSTSGPLRTGLELLWEIHHQVHAETLDRGPSNHLSDELWLLPLPVPVPLPVGTVNDGSYVGAWIRAHGGTLHYAPDARVDVRVPTKVSDHVRQRRRITWGHHQVEDLLGEEPWSWVTYLRNDPPQALRTLGRALGDDPSSYLWFALFALLEVEARALAGWDRRTGGTDHVRWVPTRSEPDPEPRGPSVDRGAVANAPSPRETPGA